MPEQAHKGDMFDLFANEDIVLNSFESKIVKLGLAFDIPKGYRIKIFSRSSLPIKKQVIVSNGVGIVDEQYKNQIGLICHTLPKNFFGFLINNKVEIKRGDKIAQMQLEKIKDFQIEEVEELDMKNDRGGGFGSTDKVK
ncbi:dUTP diphosphatase [Romboutsia timonensis]|uniref:dUTP diphosphatase n=1 Tax=Romboutsia timonensis TaxID=1776391 RepID=UPI002A76592C|nr:hypothetical protein [Romboutsia timonensis]